MSAPTAPAQPTASQPTPPPAPGAETGKKAPLRDIGRPGAPVRAITFSGGAFDTIMQLGVAHALLVSRAVRPDVVVGVSAGAVNAVALAEVLQAGDKLPDDPEWNAAEVDAMRAQALLHAQIARFRLLLDAYRRAPGEIIDALLPDPFQVDAQRPLEPLRLPIQQQPERDGRLEAVRSRAGMINLYNQLLDLRTSIGTIARGVRVILGLKATSQISGRGARNAAILGQCLQGWLVFGANLYRIAPLVPPVLATVLRLKPRAEQGASAAEIIFQWRVTLPVRKVVAHALSLLLLVVLWLAASGLVVLAPLALVRALAHFRVPWIATHQAMVSGLLYAAVGLALGAISWRHPFMGLGRVLPYAGSFALLIVRWAAVLALPVLGVALLRRDVAFPALASAWGMALREFWFPVYVALFALCVVAFLPSVRRLFTSGGSIRPFWARLLERYDLHDSLFSAYPLRQLFVRLFDPGYYGGTRIQEAVERALGDDLSPDQQNIEGKTLKHYVAPRVGVTVADVASGRLRILEPGVRVVDGLLAATAMVPLFPPVPIDGALCVDGTNVANEPTRALLDFLRERLNPQAKIVHVYPVTPLPVSEPELADIRVPHGAGTTNGGGHARQARRYQGLVDVARRALHLQRYRDATLERRLTELYTKTIPSGTVLYPGVEPDPAAPSPTKQYVRAWVHPIEPDAPLELSPRILQAESNERRRELIAETVADGCRAALQVLMQPAIRQVYDTKPGAEPPVVACRLAVAQHLGSPEPGLPGSDAGPDSGPGVAEVCRSCAIRPKSNGNGAPHDPRPASLKVPKPDFLRPRWPSTGDAGLDPKAEEEFDRAMVQPRGDPVRFRPGWPREGNAGPGGERPLVNLLFSGGVFRGVYQMGVLNALSEVNLRPDVVAGASVGSITAAMVARVLILDDKRERQRQIARLAATYLALDRLILTDRFADFVRNLTLRAASTGVSLRQADRGFRRYDRPRHGQFERELRLVVAGLERLFYISPFELKTLVEAIRDRRYHDVYGLLRNHLQEWLVRSGIETEILGAEPLALLITQHVIEGISGLAGLERYGALEPAQVPFEVFLESNGLCLLATATNLTRGRLEILGDQQLRDDRPGLTLRDGLLASSAFPAVFRPRESWELMPATDTEDQFIDGGVIDNLPLDAVAEFLQRAAVSGRIERRPRLGPHLLFSASLETELAQPTPERLAALQGNWPALFRRTRQLGYNRKLEVYSATQRDVRDIFRISTRKGTSSPWQPLDLEVVMVQPKWLCGTFAFHPMLGFRRANQAKSMAHGCATTLSRLGELQSSTETGDWARAWGINLAALPPAGAAPLVPHDHGPNKCWFRPDIECPFSSGQVAGLDVEPRTKQELEAIYQACGRPETHRAQ